MENKTPRIIVGVDHGFKNIKTAHTLFPAAISEIKTKPENLEDILEYDGKLYSLNGEQVYFVDTQDKTQTEDYYLLTLAAIAKEMKARNLTKANILLAVGLPFKWFDKQKDNFKNYLMKNSEVVFKFEGKRYVISLEACKVFVQGHSAIAPNISKYAEGHCVLVDIGGGTMVVLPMFKGKPLIEECMIDTKASLHLYTMIKQRIESEFYNEISDYDITEAINSGKQSTNDEYLNIIQEELEKYSEYVFRRLKEFRINLERTPVVFMGGGSMIIKNFGSYNANKTSFVLDLNANAKGYEYIMQQMLKRKRG
ncbi:MAG: ParM/StbA family protein [Lachnospiraceae bacterium]|nr:ParM/StbA family protein [Lachnospiraceae bacterium]